MAAVPLRGRRAALGPGAAGEPECKRLCRLLDTLPGQAAAVDLDPRQELLLDTLPGQAAAQLRDGAMDLDPRQKLLPDPAPGAAKTKQNSMALENHGSRGISQPCPRCVAGESGHFSHILGS